MQFWPITTVLFGFLICMELDQSNWGGNFVSKTRPPFCLRGVHFQFPLEAAFPQFANLLLIKFLFLRHPRWGLLLALDWWQHTLVDSKLLLAVTYSATLIFFFPLYLYHTVLPIIAFSSAWIASQFQQFLGFFHLFILPIDSENHFVKVKQTKTVEIFDSNFIKIFEKTMWSFFSTWWLIFLSVHLLLKFVGEFVSPISLFSHLYKYVTGSLEK